MKGIKWQIIGGSGGYHCVECGYSEGERFFYPVDHKSLVVVLCILCWVRLDELSRYEDST